MTTLLATEYQVTAYLAGTPIAHAIRTVWGWHIPMRGADARWVAVDSRAEAEQVLTRFLAGRAA